MDGGITADLLIRLDDSDTVSLLLDQPGPEVSRNISAPQAIESISSLNQDDMDIIDFYDEAYQQIEAKMPSSDSRFIKRIYSIINAAGKMGIQGNDLFKQFPIVSESLLRDILEKLCKLAHPVRGVCIVSRVGYQKFAYVSHRYIAEWTIAARLNEDGGSMDQAERNDPKDFTPPYLWFDINGNKAVRLISNFKVPLLRTCMETVMSWIVRRPGIYEVCFYLYSSFSRRCAPTSRHSFAQQNSSF
jgi:hypothetical protein